MSVAKPFLTLQPDQVTASPWEVSSAVAEPAAEQNLENWNYQIDLKFSRTLKADLEDLINSLQIEGDEHSFAIAVTVGSGEGTLPRRTECKTFHFTDGVADLSFVLKGMQLSTRVSLVTEIVLSNAVRPLSVIAPRSVGTVVWSDDFELNLEGPEPRFPVDVVSFSEEAGIETSTTAPWLLSWSPSDLENDFGASVRLLINSDNEVFLSRFLSAETLTLQTVMSDVMGQMIETVLNLSDEEIDLVEDAEQFTVAGHIASWIELAFPERDLAYVRQLRLERPGIFRTAILTAAEPPEVPS